jgi:ribosomal-protein-alanine acetyltransferase
LKTALIIDTSTDHTIVGLVSNSKLLKVHSHNDAIAHGEVLPKLVQQLITEHRDVNLEQVVVGMGPGLFTGLRAGIAFAKMFALAKNLDCVGVCSLDAAALPAGKYVIANDAKRREYFYATYENGARISELQVGPLNLIKDLGLEVKLDQLPDVMMMYKAAQANQLTTQPIYLRKPDAYPAPKGVTFRAMNQLDLVNVSALEKICYPKDAWSIAQFKSELAGVPKTHHYLVAEVDNQIVGYAGIFGIDEVADVHTLSVDPKFRRRGIGRELLRRLIDWSRTRKMKAMMLEVRIANDEAIVLYKEQGFSVISQRENYYGPGQTAYVMRKELQ